MTATVRAVDADADADADGTVMPMIVAAAAAATRTALAQERACNWNQSTAADTIDWLLTSFCSLR